MSDIAQSPAASAEIQFTIGRSLSLTFGVLGRNFMPMAILAVIVSAAQTAVDYALTGDVTGGEDGGNSFLGLFTYALITAPVTYATFQDLRGTPVTMAQLFSRGFARVIRVMITAFALGFVLLVPIGAIIFAGVSIGIPVGLLVAVSGVFAIAVFVRWFVVIPVQVVEQTRFGAGFGRASALSQGERWPILGVLLIYVVLVVALTLLMFLLVYIAGGAPVITALIIVPFSAFFSVVGAILPAVVYYLLRAQKDGIGIDEIARVFD